MFAPMFDAEESVLGLPADLVVLVVGAALSVVGVLWMRRVTAVDEPRAGYWWAAGPRRNPWLWIGALLLVAAAGLTFLLR